jgi:hypothetical protein
MTNSPPSLWQKPAFKRFIWFLILIFAVILLINVTWHQHQEAHYRKYLPAEFQDFSYVKSYDGISFFDLPLMIFIREVPGCAIFEMTPKWVEKVNREGLSSLRSTHELAYKAKVSPENYPNGGEWRETPIIAFGERRTNPLPRGLSGLAELPHELEGKIMPQLNEPGSFYTICTQLSRDSCLIIIPKLKWVIFAYDS